MEAMAADAPAWYAFELQAIAHYPTQYGVRAWTVAASRASKQRDTAGSGTDRTVSSGWTAWASAPTAATTGSM